MNYMQKLEDLCGVNVPRRAIQVNRILSCWTLADLRVQIS